MSQDTVPETYNAQSTDTISRLDAVVIGAGFSGLYALHRLRGMGFKVHVFEKGDGVGGTWYWNRYPGARCDAESLAYSYSFSEDLQQEWDWSERFATQPEILRYAEHVAERFDLKKDIQFSTVVESAHYDEAQSLWTVKTDKGETVQAQHLILGVGCLSSSRVPDFQGLSDFSKPWYHTGRWPHEGVDFTGKTVGIIGTGSSAIQAIPEIAKQAKHVFVFQRTPNFSVPARNAPLTPEFLSEFKPGYKNFREASRHSLGGQPFDLPTQSALEVDPQTRTQTYSQAWQKGGPTFLTGFTDLLVNEEANATAVQFVHDRIDEIVRDRDVANRLKPKTYPIGAKRICVDTDYYETFNRANVTLVDVSEDPIETLTASGLKTADASFEFDTLVFATGYDAMTGAILSIDIRGTDGLSLKDHWAAGPRTYLGIGVNGFPNMYIVAGPGSPSVLSNMLCSIEQHVEWITDCIQTQRSNGIDCFEATPEAEAEWVATVNAIASQTLYTKGNSWYLGANVPGKPRIFMPFAGGVGYYRSLCDNVVAQGYAGFSQLTKASKQDAA